MARPDYLYPIFIIVCFLAYSGNAQIITGKVIDKQTNSGIEAANIFIANYQIGTFSLDSGKYSLRLPGPGTYQLVITHVSYISYSEYVVIQKEELLQDKIIFLTPMKVELKEIEISGEKDKTWKRNLNIFKESFLGSSPNSRQCDILNPYVLNFLKKNGILTARADDLIQIENKALGYKIYFLLEHFQRNIDNEVSYSGKPYFEQIPSLDEKDIINVQKQRTIAYNGSRRHFLNSLLGDRLAKEGYEAQIGSISLEKDFLPSNEASSKRLIKYDSTSNKLYLALGGDWLRVIYKREKGPGENQNADYRQRHSNNGYNIIRDGNFQVSYLYCVNPMIKILSNGIIEDAQYVHEFGYWATEGISDLLPYDYTPDFIK